MHSLRRRALGPTRLDGGDYSAAPHAGASASAARLAQRVSSIASPTPAGHHGAVCTQPVSTSHEPGTTCWMPPATDADGAGGAAGGRASSYRRRRVLRARAAGGRVADTPAARAHARATSALAPQAPLVVDMKPQALPAPAGAAPAAAGAARRDSRRSAAPRSRARGTGGVGAWVTLASALVVVAAAARGAALVAEQLRHRDGAGTGGRGSPTHGAGTVATACERPAPAAAVDLHVEANCSGADRSHAEYVLLHGAAASCQPPAAAPPLALSHGSCLQSRLPALLRWMPPAPSGDVSAECHWYAAHATGAFTAGTPPTHPRTCGGDAVCGGGERGMSTVGAGAGRGTPLRQLVARLHAAAAGVAVGAAVDAALMAAAVIAAAALAACARLCVDTAARHAAAARRLRSAAAALVTRGNPAPLRQLAREWRAVAAARGQRAATSGGAWLLRAASGAA